MSLATRCSACGTMFRVVQDQLRVSEGWVRCGRCDNVFNALDALVDLEAEADHVAAATDPAPVADARAHHEPRDWSEAGALAEPSATAGRLAESALAGAHRELQEEPVPPDTAPLADEAQTRPVSALRQPSAVDIDASARSALSPSPPAAPAAKSSPFATPGFMRQAERAAHWTSPAMRAALSGVALMLLAVLAMQATYHFRDEVAARSASASHLLRSACARWGCSIQPPRRLHEVTLESHALSRLAQQPRAVKLTINLRNRGGTDLALPAIDLSLTDASGQLIARRALLPGDFHIDPPLIARGTELPLEVVLSAGERNIVGYTVELFYP